MKKNITKLLIGTITEKEIIELRDWLEDPSNQSVLEVYVRDYHDLNLATLKNNLDKAYVKVSYQIDINEKPVKKLFPIWTKYAAAIILLFSLGFFYQQGFFAHHERDILVPNDDSITLELDNGVIQNIDIKGVKEVRDSEGNVVGAQNQNQISYSQASQKRELVFNTLKIPNGKKFQLVLSDGTSVYLNAGSSLRYPVNFLSEGPRRVYLSGEAYFDVTKNESNAFIVNVDELNVNVLGTQFNISSYPEDQYIDVVLVEGTVRLNRNDRFQDEFVELSPGQKGYYKQDSEGIMVDEVNTLLYTSWMEGSLVFRDLTFDQILVKLERHYNVNIENTDAILGKEVFNASFSDVEIEEVLSYFNDIHEIKYTIKNNTAIINRSTTH